MKKILLALLLISTSACNPDITSLCSRGYTIRNGKGVTSFNKDLSGLDAVASITLDDERKPQLELTLTKNNFNGLNKNEAQIRANDSLWVTIKTQYAGNGETLPLNEPIPITYTYSPKPQGQLRAEDVEGRGELILREQEVEQDEVYRLSQNIQRLAGEFKSLEENVELTGSFEIERNILSEICQAQ